MLTKEPWFISNIGKADGRGWKVTPSSWQGLVLTIAMISAPVVVTNRWGMDSIRGIGAVIGISAAFALVVFLTRASKP